MTAELVATIRQRHRALLDAIRDMADRCDRGSTHWDGCVEAHPRCGVYQAQREAGVDVKVLADIAEAGMALRDAGGEIQPGADDGEALVYLPARALLAYDAAFKAAMAKRGV